MSVSYGGDKITFDDGSSLSTGYTHFRNRIINGDMRIHQRGGTISASGQTNTFGLDRFKMRTSSGSAVVSMQQSTTVPAGFYNSMLCTVTTADASLGADDLTALVQTIEGTNVTDLDWGNANAKTVTLSFWVRSSIIGTYGCGVQNDASNRSYPSTFTVNAADTWEYKTITIPGDTTGTWSIGTTSISLYVFFSLGAGSNFTGGTTNAWNAGDRRGASGQVNWAGTLNATFYVTGVQLEVGSYATTFERRPYGTELALCQRYYYKLAPVGSGLELIPGLNPGTTSNLVKVPLPVSMRIKPSIEISSAGWGFVRNRGSFTAYTTTGVSSRDGSQPAFAYFDATVASGLTSAEIGYTAINDGSWLAFSAEI